LTDWWYRTAHRGSVAVGRRLWVTLQRAIIVKRFERLVTASDDRCRRRNLWAQSYC